jgi:predicted transcriptional regulator
LGLITAKCLDEEDFVWEPQEFRMPGVEKAEDVEKWKETQEAPEGEATKPERTEETDFDVKSISTYTESFVELEAIGSEIGNDMGDRDTWSEAGDDAGLEERAAGKGVLRVDALLTKNAIEAKYDPVSEWAGKVTGKAMDQRTARGPNEDGEEIAGNGGEDETVIGGEAQGGEAKKSDSGSGSFQVPSV